MGNNIGRLLCIILCMTCICACGNQQGEEENHPSKEVVEYSDLSAHTITELAGKDNSKDVYSAIANEYMKIVKPEGAIVGGNMDGIVCDTRAYYLKKHLFAVEEWEKSYDEIFIATVDGYTDTIIRDINNQILDIGTVLGTDHYLAYIYKVAYDSNNTKIYPHYLQEYDEKHNLLQEIPLSFIDGEMEDAKDSIMDAQNRIHCIIDSQYGRDGAAVYYIISTTGEVLWKCAPEDGYTIDKLLPIYDGYVACYERKNYEAHEKLEKLEYRITYLNTETGEVETLLEWAEAWNEPNLWMTLWDENTRLYANADGLYKSDLKGGNSQCLYRWINHGITVSSIYTLRPLADQRIGLIYGDEDGQYYLCLEPTTEQVEIMEIVMAVSLAMEKAYKPVVAEFNKKYPACQIVLKSNYDETALLTELIAGQGPVLVDSSLTGFESQEKLWEPLDKVFQELEITDSLQSSAVELGKIDGTLYGVVTDFWIETVVAADAKYRDWDYDTFLQCIRENNDLESVVNRYGEKGDWLRFLQQFFNHGLEDNYFVDIEKGTTNFDSKEFRQLLQLMQDYCMSEEFIEPVTHLEDGRVLCNTISIQKPQEVALYRASYGEDIHYVGFPGKEGASHYINSRSPVTIRKSASKEEKELACAFLQMLLSYEYQMKLIDDLNFHLSIRADVLDAQIHGVNEKAMVNVSGFGTFVVGDDVDNEKDAEILYSLLDTAKPYKTLPKEVNSIISEELQKYFNGEITEDMAIEHLENRVQLYLDERY